jgi:hypothetical protein
LQKVTEGHSRATPNPQGQLPCLPLPDPSPFLRGQRLRDKPQGMGRWLGQLVVLGKPPRPQPGPKDRSALPCPSSPPQVLPPRAALRWPIRNQACFHPVWDARGAKSPLLPATPRGAFGGLASVWSAWGSHFPSPTAGVQVPGPGRGAGGADAGESWPPAGRKRQTAAGPARSRAPLPPRHRHLRAGDVSRVRGMAASGG